MTRILNPEFYSRDVLIAAPQLLGKRLVRMLDGVRIAGIITETEAYRGEEDLACHAKAGRTPRTEVMYGPPGTAYVYFTYGMHWMLNCVCGPEGFPAAVLIRAIQPVEGLETIAARRSGVKEALWCKPVQAGKRAMDRRGWGQSAGEHRLSSAHRHTGCAGAMAWKAVELQDQAGIMPYTAKQG